MRTRKTTVAVLFFIVVCLTVIFALNKQSNLSKAGRIYEPASTDLSDRPTIENLSNDPLYELNPDGFRYGSGLFVDEGFLDLIQAEATNGKIGYVWYDDLNEPAPESPVAAANYVSTERFIPVYEEDGRTVIGEFLIASDLTVD